MNRCTRSRTNNVTNTSTEHCRQRLNRGKKSIFMFWICRLTEQWAAAAEKKKIARNWINKANSQAIAFQRVNLHKRLGVFSFLKSTSDKFRNCKYFYCSENKSHSILESFYTHFNNLTTYIALLARFFFAFYLLSFWYSSVISILHALWIILWTHTMHELSQNKNNSSMDGVPACLLSLVFFSLPSSSFERNEQWGEKRVGKIQ